MAGESVKVVNPLCSKISNMIITENGIALPVVKSEPVGRVVTLQIASSFSCLVKAGCQSFLVCLFIALCIFCLFLYALLAYTLSLILCDRFSVDHLLVLVPPSLRAFVSIILLVFQILSFHLQKIASDNYTILLNVPILQDMRHIIYSKFC